MRKKRQLRRIISGILIALLACNIGLMISVAVYHFGVYEQSVMVRSLESGYFKEKFEKAQSEITEILETAGLSKSIISFDDLEMGFERRMRSQVLNRSDAAAELNSINLANSILDCIDEQGIVTTLKAEEGIALLSQTLSQILFRQSEVLGMEQWYDDVGCFSEKTLVLMMVLVFLAAAIVVAIGFLRSRKYRIFIDIATGLAVAGIIGIAISVVLFIEIQAGTGRAAIQTMSAYRQEVLFAGLKISAAVFVIAAILSILGLAIKKIQQAF